MKTMLRFTGLAGLLFASCTAAAATAPLGGDTAAVACEAAAADTLRDMRGKAAHEVQFVAAKRVVPPTAGDNVTLAGQGQYRARAGAAQAFNYTCSYDVQTGKASGVVLRENEAPAAAAEKPWEPDLTHVSPEACEAAAAAALKDQYPPAGAIRFQSDSRSLRRASNARTSLEGQGSLERVVGMNPAPFTYRCVFEASSGKVVSVQTRD
ncbi:MAG: hypothetical protein H0W40_16690 [Methylibium sp.]|uniref:hypothetical protein n=1 Tax=Methylibium sp. TaxID=2067992 RepID=UPI0017EA0C9E|nr:hypothetical protein [Methylibium sp.]MBA3598993.1 hypothetical protein [Methylibium sp.]